MAQCEGIQHTYAHTHIHTHRLRAGTACAEKEVSVKKCEYTIWLLLSFLPTTRGDAAPGLPDTKRTSVNVRLEKQASLRNWCCCVTSLSCLCHNRIKTLSCTNSPHFEWPRAAPQHLMVNWSKQEVETADVLRVILDNSSCSSSPLDFTLINCLSGMEGSK